MSQHVQAGVFMVATRFLLVALAVMASLNSVQAREAEVTAFEAPLESAVPNTADENTLAHALLQHFQALGLPNGQVGVSRPAQNNGPDRPSGGVLLANSAVLRPNVRRRFCPKMGYVPAWWLAPAVEVRRAAHFDAMASIACEFGLPTSLLDATIAQESGYKPTAVSSAGAKGMLQVMPATAKSLGLRNPFDPIANLRAGASYLRQQIDRFGRIDLALAAYNAGPERPSLLTGRIPNLGETRNYVRTIITNWERLTRRHGGSRTTSTYPLAPPALYLRQVELVHLESGPVAR